MSQKAIKKRTIDNLKNSVRIPVQPLSTKNNNNKSPSNGGGSLPQKTFPLNKFIALPEALRLKSKSSSTSSDELKSPKRSTPIKAVAIPQGGRATSSYDSRAHVYLVDGPEGVRTDLTSEAYITTNNVDYTSTHNNTALSTGYYNHQQGSNSVTIDHNRQSGHQYNGADRSRNSGVKGAGPFATSTPRAGRRGYHSAQNSPKRDLTSNQGSITSNNDSFDSGGSTGSRKRRYKKRSQSAPPGSDRRKLQETDLVLQQWSDNDRQSRSRTERSHGAGRVIEYDGISIQSENWMCANVGRSPNGVVQTVYRSNSISSPVLDNRSGDSSGIIKPAAYFNTSSHSELEFTDVCKVNSTFRDNSLAQTSANGSLHSLDFASSDTCFDDLTGGYSISKHSTGQDWDNKSDVVYSTRTVEDLNGRKHAQHNGWSSSNLGKKSLSEFDLDKLEMEAVARNRSMNSMNSSASSSRSYTVNGIPQTGIVIRTPGRDHVLVNDVHKAPGQPGPVPDYYGHEFYTMGRKQGTLMQSKLKFSSMPSLHDGKGDKKLLKLLKKQEKEERKRKEKEERKRAKEEKKRQKMEKKLNTKTLPRNFAYTNGHVLSPAMENMYRRPKLSMTAVPIDIEGDNISVASTVTPAPKMAPPPLPGPSHRTMSMYQSAPDLLRLEQVYGATLRGNNRDTRVHSRPPIPNDYGPRTVVLQRAPEGYGFVLRGAKSQLKPSGELDFRPSAEFPALQYLDSVDPGSVSDRAGLRAGDFILEINGENVIRASHDRVVHLIRSTGDTLAMKVVTVRPGNRGQDWFIHQDRSLTLPNRQKKKAAPTPPQRDPRTSLSMSKSEGRSISEEMMAMEKLDLAITGKREAEETKTASIRNRTAAKRVSVVELDNIGVNGKLERAKSTSDLVDGGNTKARKDIIYATPTVPDKKSNVYATPGVNSASSAAVVTNVPPSPTGVQMRPKAAPPPPPAGDNSSPKKPAPKPPMSDSFDSSSSSEVVTINTGKQPVYSGTKILVKSTTKSESPYESSFRPGDSAKMSEEPKDKAGAQQKPGGTSVQVRPGSGDQNVTFADDKVLDHAASFLKKHPNAKLLMTAKGQESLRNRTSMMFEPEPDYDSDSGEDKTKSPVKMRDPKRQSVTVISVGEQKNMAAQAQKQKRYTVHSSIPSEEKTSSNSGQSQGFTIPPRPNGPAPTPPGQRSPVQQKAKSPAPMPPPHSNSMTVKAEINTQSSVTSTTTAKTTTVIRTQHLRRQSEPESPPALPKTPPPDFDEKPSPAPSSAFIPVAPPPPPIGAPAPPPPPPPVPTSDTLSKTKSSVKADYIATVPVPQDAIAAAVARRQERLQGDGPRMNQYKPTTPPANATPANTNQAAILAAVAKRKQQLEKQNEHSVLEAIESRLQKTKKLQAAKFSIAGSKNSTSSSLSSKKDTDDKDKTEIKSNGVSSSNSKTVTSANTTHSNGKNPVAKKTEAVKKPEREEISFKVKPVNTGISKQQSGITEIKPNFAVKPAKTVSKDTTTKQTNGVQSAKVKSQEHLRIKSQPLEKTISTAKTEKSNETNDSEQINNNKNVNGQSGFLALAEKRRQEFLSRKQKSSESKSSTASTPEKKVSSTNAKLSPPISAKPKSVSNMNGDAYGSVPPPPEGFRDMGNANTVVQLEIIPPPANFSTDNESSTQHSPAFSPDTASLVSSLSTLSSLSGDQTDGRGNGFDDIIAPPPPGFDDSDSALIPPPPEFGNDNKKKTAKTFNDKVVDAWLCNDVLNWLDSLSMSQYKSSFQKNCIDGKKLLSLTRTSYISLGVSQVGHRMTIERAIKKAEIKQKNAENNVIASEHL